MSERERDLTGHCDDALRFLRPNAGLLDAERGDP